MKRLFLILMLPVLVLSVRAQELQANVLVNYQNLPTQNKENLSGFQAELERYLNNTQFTGGQWKFAKINCTFNISITSAADLSSYSAQVIVVSQRYIDKSKPKAYTPLLRVLDNNWSFSYERNQPLYYNTAVFNSISSLLDYYAFMILGMENDSWDKFSGSPFFAKAYDIVNLGASSKYSKGWESTSGNFNRKDFVDNITNEKYRPIREAFNDYHYGIDFIGRDRAKGQKFIIEAIKKIESIKSKLDVRSVYVRVFFEAKYPEIIESLKDLKDKDLLKTLKGIDPQHSAKYEEDMK